MPGSWILSGIGRGNDYADRFLVEPFESAMALQVFEMAADGAFIEELVVLRGRDKTCRHQLLQPRRLHFPTFSFSKGLAKKIEIRKRFHRFHAAIPQLITQQMEIKTGFEVVHARLQKAFTMQA